MATAHDDVLTPFLDTHADVFLTWILPRVNAPARPRPWPWPCLCELRNPVMPESFFGNFILPQVNRRLRELVPGYRTVVEEDNLRFEKYLFGNVERFYHRYLWRKYLRTVVLLNASASVREWLLEYVTLTDEQRAFDDVFQSDSGPECSLRSHGNCFGNACMFCAYFCKGCFEESKDVRKCRAACSECASLSWLVCHICMQFYCDDCEEEKMNECESSDCFTPTCQGCALKFSLQCSSCCSTFCEKCAIDQLVAEHKCCKLCAADVSE